MYPRLTVSRAPRVVTDTFLGYRHRMKISEGEWYDTENLTTEHFPVLSTRNKRGTLNNTYTDLQAIIAKDALYWVDNGTLYANGYATGLTGLQTAKPTQLVSMGAYICIFPDKKYYNTMDGADYGSMGTSWSYTGDISYRMCHQDGTVYEHVTKSDTEPEDPENGDVWISTKNGTANEYSVWTQTWTVIETVYTRVGFETTGQLPTGFKEYDGVRIEGLYDDDLNGSKILYAVGGQAESGSTPAVADYIVIVGIQETAQTESGTATISRVVPEMDYVCEAQNRLWGCYYGNDGTQNINEVYCCALGDFRNWEQYLGVSTDSWRASRGSDGKWTGCINYLGTPTFFKENVIHPISVSSVGAHQIGDIPARGVQDGAWRSLAVVNETLYYKARAGVMAYQGGMPAEVGEALGDERYSDAVAGVFGNRYYISMKNAANEWNFFCYDVQKGLWMREDNLKAEEFARWGDELYVRSNNQVICLNGTEGVPESQINWRADTGLIYYEQSMSRYGQQPVRYISRFNIKLSMERNAEMRVFIEYDSSGLWTYQQTVRLHNTGTVTVPIKPRRCDHMRIRLEGRGAIRIYSIARLMDAGSDV